ncbi:GGDEF domain-containing protein [Bordetella sp. H567]|uniref:GGDEF domain-containing protein n=1 Tax=Bordetella sp. H567 TaxID=1697043 RepID=UPI001314CC80|nr:GGDEF domain-containing protein [Bordetella sp. H567]
MTPPHPATAKASDLPQDETWHAAPPAPRRRGLAAALITLLVAMALLALVTGATLFTQSRVVSQPAGADIGLYSYRLVSQMNRLIADAQKTAAGGDHKQFVRDLQALSTFVNPGTAESAPGVALVRSLPAARVDVQMLDDRLRTWREAADTADAARIRAAARDLADHADEARLLADRLGGAVHQAQRGDTAQHNTAVAEGFRRLQWAFVGLLACSGILAIWLLVLNRHARHFNQRMAQANARLESAVAHRTRQLVWLANTDPLTGLKNRRAFMETAEAQILQCRRYPHPLAALLIDIDHFKSINDRYGHHVGDQAIRRVTDTITNTLRDSDIIGRFGGEEFAVLMPHTDLPAALVAAERLRQAVAGMKIGLLEGGPLSMTISLGLAMHEPGVSLDTLLMRADMALYRAKSGSRNRVEVYGREREEIAQ